MYIITYFCMTFNKYIHKLQKNKDNANFQSKRNMGKYSCPEFAT